MKITSVRVCLLPVLLLAGLALVLAGCGSAPKARTFNLKIELDSSLAGSSIQVDVIGANAVSDLPKWQSYSVTEYWKPGNAMRRNADKVVREFGQGKERVQFVNTSDPAWNRWLAAGALHLVVLVDLPGIADDQAGNADPRRLIIPLDASVWPAKTASVDLLVQESGVRLLTPTKQR